MVAVTEERSSKMVEEELMNLKKRFALLEGDRKAFYENSQWSIKSNSERIQQLRDSNRSLRHSVIQMNKGRTDKPTTSPIEKVERILNHMRSRLDDLQTISSKKDEMLEGLNDCVVDLNREDHQSNEQKEGESEKGMRIRRLENRLEKAQIKFSEAQSIRRTYEQIARRLQQERLTYDSQLAALEGTIKLKRKDLSGLELMSRDAHHSKEIAQSNLIGFETMLVEDRKVREKELLERKELVRQTLSNAERTEQRRQQRVVAEEGSPAKAIHGKPNTRGSAESEAEQAIKISTFEEAFFKIKETTGVSNISEIVEKFATQGETHDHLLKLKTETEERMMKMRNDRTALQAQLNQLMYSSEVSSGARRIMDELEAQVREAEINSREKLEQWTRTQAVLQDVKAGIAHLCSKVGSIGEATPTESGAMSEEKVDSHVVEALAKCEDALMRILAKIEDMAASGIVAGADELVGKPQDLPLPQYNLRIKLPDADGQEIDESSDEEDGGPEDVLSRDIVKKQSCSLVEAKTQKKKKGRGRRRAPGK